MNQYCVLHGDHRWPPCNTLPWFCRGSAKRRRVEAVRKRAAGLHHVIGRDGHVTSAAGFGLDHAVAHHDRTAPDRRRRPARDPHAFVGGIVLHQRFGQPGAAVRVPQHQVGVGARAMRPLACRPNSREGWPAVSRTKSDAVMRPVATPSLHSSGRQAARPGTPLGMAVNGASGPAAALPRGLALAWCMCGPSG